MPRERDKTLGEELSERGMSRRTFLKFCATMASMMALPPAMAQVMADSMAKARKPSVLYLSFQECTGCVESWSRSHSPTLESLILDFLSLEYQHTLMAAAGDQAEAARERVMKENAGKYILIVDGAIPLGNPGYGTVSGMSFADLARETAEGAGAVIALGTCAAFGGIPKANPNPTGAVSLQDLIRDKPVINVSGCPPIPVVIAGVVTHYLTFGTVPALDRFGRPMSFYGETIHDRCYRRPYYDQGKFAKTFDDEGARKGWCLFELGCKGPVTYNACATVKWNQGTSFPIESGHGCIGCASPDFWDRGSFYTPLSAIPGETGAAIGGAAVAGAAVGAAAAVLARRRQKAITKITPS